MTESEQRKLLLEDRRALLDALFQLTKWLIATLFLLNGAAALAALSRPGLDPIIASLITLYFVNGIMAVIIGAVGFVVGLLVSWVRVMHILKPFSRRAFVAIIVGQLIAAVMAVSGFAFSVDYFITGVRMWGNVSIAEAEQRMQDARKPATKPSKVPGPGRVNL